MDWNIVLLALILVVLWMIRGSLENIHKVLDEWQTDWLKEKKNPDSYRGDRDFGQF